jgi:sugar lactone lactonase YvrE
MTKKIRFFLTSNKSLPTGIIVGRLIFLLIGAGLDPARAQGARVSRNYPTSPSPFAPIPDTLYETTFRKDNVEIFSSNGVFLGLVGKIGRPTGLAFDAAGNLFVSSDDRTAGYSIKKVSAVDGTISIFTTMALGGPHGIAFDRAGNLYVANNNNNTVVSYTPDGVATIFADEGDGLVNPIGLAFDAAGNLFVTNAKGGPTRSGKVVKVTSEGVGSDFADVGFQTAYGIAFDAAGNVYVSNNTGNRVEKFAPDGMDLGVFCSSNLNAPLGIMFDSSGCLYVANGNSATIEKFAPDGRDLGVFVTTRKGPHFMAIYYSSQMSAESDH